MTGGRRLDAGGIWAMGGMTRAGGGGGVGTKKEEASWRKRTRSQASIGVRVWLRASSASAQGIDSEGGKVERKEARRASSVGVLSRGGEGRVCCLKSLGGGLETGVSDEGGCATRAHEGAVQSAGGFGEGEKGRTREVGKQLLKLFAR